MDDVIKRIKTILDDHESNKKGLIQLAQDKFGKDKQFIDYNVLDIKTISDSKAAPSHSLPQVNISLNFIEKDTGACYPFLITFEKLT